MSKFIIRGGKKLSGEIRVFGNKNAVLPIMAASILVDGETTLTNIPMIKDVEVMSNILTKLGAKITFENDHKLTINCQGVNSTKIDPFLAKKLRASVLLIGPLISRFGKVEIVHPGGDIIGRRSIDAHLDAFSCLGVKTARKGNSYFLVRQNKIKKGDVFLSEPSVTASENIITASSLGESEVILDNAAMEPHVVDLCLFLKKAGAQIEGAGTNKLRIIGQRKLKGINHEIITDHVEAGTFAIIAALCAIDKIRIYPVREKDLKMILYILSQFGVHSRIKNDSLFIFPSKLKAMDSRIQAGPWPMFPTDLMSPLIVLATQIKGQTLFHDPMYESRMFFVDKLIRMGAQITICDPHRVIVYGQTSLQGGSLNSPDIRAGVALVLAALIAKGESAIDQAEIIERGYEKLEKRLSQLGAYILKHE